MMSAILLHPLNMARRCVPYSCRTLSLSSVMLCKNIGVPLMTKNLKMQPFSKLQLSSNIPVWIKPLNPHDFPQMDEFILSIWNSSKTDDNIKDQFKVDLQESGDLMDVKMSGKDGLPIFCDIKLPLNCDLDLLMKNNVEMSKMESGHLKVIMEDGDCRLNSMKCATVDIHSLRGDVSSKRSLHGDLTLKLVEGKLTADRIQGQNLKVTNLCGDVSIKSLYAVTSSIHCQNGNIDITSCHGEMDVQCQRGNVDVGSLDGNLKVESMEGDVNVHIMRHISLDVSTHSGDIHITTDELTPSEVDLTARQVEIGSEMALKEEKRKQNGEVLHVKGTLRAESKSKITAHAPGGKISFRFREWLSTLKLKTGLQ